MRLRHRSLRTHLVGHFLLLSLTLVVVAGALAWIGARTALERTALDRLSVVAALQEKQLELWVSSQRREVVLLASLPEVRTLAAAVLDPVAAEPSRREAHRRLRDFLASALDLEPDLDVIFLLNAADGRVAVSTRPGHEGTYCSRDSFFIEGQRGTHLQSVYASRRTLQPTATVATPLGPPSEPIGVLAAHLDLVGMDRLLQERAGLGATSEIYLVDSSNAFISGERFGRDRFPHGVRSGGIDAGLQGRSGSGRYRNYAQVPVLGAWRWIEPLEVVLLAETTQAEAFAPARRIAWRIAGIGLGFAVLFTLGTVVLAKRIAAPLTQIAAAAERVAGGDLKVTAPVVSNDEIGTLARNFNDMTTALEALYGDLRQEIAEHQLAKDERERFVEELAAKNTELERFTYTVSHDLKSPLVTIQGFLGLLREDLEAGAGDRSADDMRRIEQAADSMYRMLDELLELSRIGRRAIRPEEVAVDELAREAVDLNAGAIAKHRVEVEIVPGLPRVVGDRRRLLQVFQNLIGNAVKFKGGQRALHVELGIREDGGERVFYVRDNGLGIEPDHHETIFGLFQQLDRRGEGTGIGLALARRIVEQHGGRIWVESEGLERGSTFCFTLPADRWPAGPRDRESGRRRRGG